MVATGFFFFLRFSEKLPEVEGSRSLSIISRENSWLMGEFVDSLLFYERQVSVHLSSWLLLIELFCAVLRFQFFFFFFLVTISFIPTLRVHLKKHTYTMHSNCGTKLAHSIFHIVTEAFVLRQLHLSGFFRRYCFISSKRSVNFIFSERHLKDRKFNVTVRVMSVRSF